jgi:hypothetical protein
LRDLIGAPMGDVVSVRSQTDVDDSSVVGTARSGDEAATFGSFDEAGDTGFLEQQHACELEHRGFAITQDAEHPGLGDVVLGDDADRKAAELGAAAAEANIDVVIDYLWGSASALAIPAILEQRPDRGRPLDWIEIGSMAGLELTLASK